MNALDNLRKKLSLKKNFRFKYRNFPIEVKWVDDDTIQKYFGKKGNLAAFMQSRFWGLQKYTGVMYINEDVVHKHRDDALKIFCHELMHFIINSENQSELHGWTDVAEEYICQNAELLMETILVNFGGKK